MEERLSLSGLGASTPSGLVPADVTVRSLELENTFVSNFSAPTQRPGGSQQIIAILNG